MSKWHIWDNGGNSSGPHNWRFAADQIQALIPQDKKMNDKHIKELVNEWMQKHSAGPVLTKLGNLNPQATKARQLAEKKLAEDWAKKNEPKRYLNPLLRPINGIKADDGLRRVNGNTAILSSSWVGDAKFPAAFTMNPQQVTFDLNGKDYTFKLNEIGGYEGLKKCLSSDSIGSYISKNWIGKLPSSKKNWKVSKKGVAQEPGWLKSFHKKNGY